MDRDKLVRAHLDAYSDLTWAKELEPKFRQYNLDEAEMKEHREAWNRHTEARDWQWWLNHVKDTPDAKLREEIAECKAEIAAIRTEAREKPTRETFELSREVGYAHFLAENFHRPDPALVRLGPEERKEFLREWWDGARERMYESYREQVAGMSNDVLARNREAYKEFLAAAGGRQEGTRGTPRAPLEAEPRPSPGQGKGPEELARQLFGGGRETAPAAANDNDRGGQER
jgi:hypothetical protein